MCVCVCVSSIRLEFNSEECQYYTELDAVKLVGKAQTGTYLYQKDSIGLGFVIVITTNIKS